MLTAQSLSTHRSRFKRLKSTLLAAILASSASGIAQAESLTEIYQLAVENDPDIASAEATYQAGKTGKARALAELLPRLSGSYRWEKHKSTQEFIPGAPTTSSGAYDSESYSARLTQNVFNLQALFGYRQALSLVDQAMLVYISEQQNLIVRSAEAYFDVLRQEDNLASAEAEERAIGRQLEQTQQRYEVGLIAITDVHESQAAFDLAVANRLVLEAALGIAKESLAQLTGEYFDKLDRLADDFEAVQPEPADISQWVAFAENNSPQLKLAEQQLTAAKENARVKNSAFAPTISGFAQYSKNRNSAFSSSSRSENDTFGIEAEWELFRGGAKWAERREAGYQRVAAQADLAGAQREVVQTTRSAYLNTSTDAAKVKARQRAIVSSTSALDATQAGYDAGTRNIVDLLNAQRDLYSAQRDYANARYDYILNSLRLKQAAGTITAADLDAIPLQLNQALQAAPAASATE